MAQKKRSSLRNWLEYASAWLLLESLSLLPRRAAIFAGQLIARVLFSLHAKARHVGHRNLEMAMPELNADERARILKGVVNNLGRLLGEFSQFPKITRENINRLVVYDGFENYERAAEQGRGVLLLTGHFGAWELCAFAQGAYGHPLSFLVRPLDNPLLDRLINRYRELSGNRTIDKNRSVKSVLETLRRGNDVGLLIDANTLADQGVFCDFFGIPACSTTGLAVFALRSDAPVVPGFLIWDEQLKKHHLRFEPEVPLIRTGDFKEEVRINTARFTKIIEEQVRRYPDQWLWIHRRWNTRPEGEPSLYGRELVKLPENASVKIEAKV
ncbi:MAG TPA: lysophospholipid acyltransferase family protein [Blastocatellia bacterium]|nr:lysophospholipid acyltransferase family protein [Blastocatellia bacterium]